MTITLYGIKACDTMKKARVWLEENNVEFDFHDYKKEAIDRESLEKWLSKVPWDELINKRGTTWRKLPDERKQDIDNEKAISIMMENNSIIKRPVLEIEDSIYLGFKADQYANIFN